MRDLTDSTDLLSDPAALRARFVEDSYLYFRRLLPPGGVRAVRGLILTVLEDSRWLADGTDPEDLVASGQAVGEGAAGFHGMYTAVQMLQEFHEFAVQPALTDLTAGVLGEPVFCHPMHICRISPPATSALSTPVHQDYRLIQGTADTLTTWIPLADTPRETGGLRVLAGSHHLGVLPVDRADGPGGMAAAIPDDDPRWRTTEFTAGDVLLFCSLTLHGAVPNRSDRLRLSADFRYQPRTAPVARRERGFAPHYHPTVPDWRTLSRGWTSTRSLEVPPDLVELDAFDPHTADMPTPPSRFHLSQY